MPMMIDGSQVYRGDALFSHRAGVMGTVTLIGDNFCTLTVHLESGSRDLNVSQGGVVGGRKDASWHAPLTLSLPKGSESKLAKIQQIVTVMSEVL